MPFDTICTLTLPTELFAQAIHPSRPLLTLGTAFGHVQTYRLPSETDTVPTQSSADVDSDDDTSFPLPNAKRVKISNSPSNLSNGHTLSNGSSSQSVPSSLRRSSLNSVASFSGLGAINSIWKTRRHKGSCRALAFSHDGDTLYSAGEDGLVKVANTETGQIVSKVRLPSSPPDFHPPSVLHALTPQHVIVGTDSGDVLVYDARENSTGLSAKPSKTYTDVQGDREPVTSITPLTPTSQSTSGFPNTFCCVGGSTVAVLDIRKGPRTRSEPQEDELGPAIFATGLRTGGASSSVGQKLIVGTSSSTLSLFERGVWDDLDERIRFRETAGAIEGLCLVPERIATVRLKPYERAVAVGLENGYVDFVRLGPNQIMEELRCQHDTMEGAAFVGFDVEGRMVTGGGNVVKVWTGVERSFEGERNGFASGSDDSEDEGEEDEASDSSEEEVEKTSRKKRKRGKGKDRSGGSGISFEGLV